MGRLYTQIPTTPIGSFILYTPSVLCLAHEFARNYFFSCERHILSKPKRLDSIGEDVLFDVYLQCSQKKSWVS